MSLTVENQLYGGGYRKCSRCGVMRPPGAFSLGPGDSAVCTADTATRCEEWKATLQRATQADIKRAAEQLLAKVKPTPDELLAEVHAAKPFATITTYAFPLDSK